MSLFCTCILYIAEDVQYIQAAYLLQVLDDYNYVMIFTFIRASSRENLLRGFRPGKT